ncbi:TRAP transporter large permease subunit [Bacillus sp. Cr_A10]|uniref:TRAP transporter large permease subunit n=1 Tax=Bacillaceae TaxID=186817 RepID=UPI0023DC9F50|nr:TRAP transporter large permease subunit [Bacillus sp. Cr_A10]MDF2066915.1 TRAP transporter large permease subunit [Bacillus sp. Cr_A10]
MGIGFIALIVFIALIIFWSAVLKRNIGEAMIVGFIVTALFGGADAPRLIWEGVIFGATNEVLFAAMAFVFMAYVIDKTLIINKLVEILNSLLGRIPGGAAHVSTFGSALMGMISGSGSGNTASVGSITIPWMIRSNWKKEQAATIAAGNAGLGTIFPPSGSMFILLGFAPIAAVVSEGQLYIAMLVAGTYQVVYRILLISWFVYRNKIKALPMDFIQPLKQSFRVGWTSLFIFLGIIIPVLITIGPLAESFIANPNIGADAMDEISLIVWVPILIIFISLLVGFAKLPKSGSDWSNFLKNSIPGFSVTGVLLLFAFAASEVLNQLGLAEDLTAIMETLNLAPWLIVLLVGILVVLVAGPLSSTATLTAVGLVSFSALVSAGVNPVIAVIALLMFSSTEGASPPSSAPIFIASGIAGAEPQKTFVPLIVYYVIPIFILGYLMAMGVLPIPV